jgi:NADH-quinone oxidoreductase chain G
MNSLKYFYINNIKFNYTLEFQSKNINDYWKYNAPLIEYCETLGINIPHYCYHKNLSISGNCRMCLVELKNSPKPIVSCSMSAKSCLNNGEVYTNSPLVKKARENVLEFLLLNHPLDCPICDQGGECDLQDQSLFFGMSKKRFYNFKRIVTDKNIGPIVKTVMTRCIHCTRCVRFASEIAGVEDLGMFGRGLSSEIGTYVTKTFQSELSGNLIDLCPVGALTSKPYPFINRSWELKNINSIDFTDGFNVDLQIYLKNNQIIKITPGFSHTTNSVNWISDKTRFAFDGMFSPERILKGFICTNNIQNSLYTTWKTLIEEIITTLYFQYHLNKHFFKIKKLIIVFNHTISLEVLNLLILFSKKYTFIQLRKSEKSVSNIDLENNFLINSNLNVKKNLLKSNLCLLIGINTRYEGSSLNLKLRERSLLGNFKILALSSILDLTFSIKYLGFNLKILQSIIQGNNIFCQELLHTKNPNILISSEIFQRQDSDKIFNLIHFLKKILNNYKLTWNNFNVLNSSNNEAGVYYLNNYKSLSLSDLSNSYGLFILNTSLNDLKLKKILNLKLLNYSFNKEWKSNDKFYPKMLIEQNNGILNKNLTPYISTYNVYNYLNLPNTTFFESTGTYLNTEGIFKKNFKFISTKKQTKEDWQIIRKIFSYSKKINFLTNTKNNNQIHFNIKTHKKYINFINFLYYTNNNLNLYKHNTNVQISGKTVILNKQFKLQKNKIFKTKFKLWLTDFYLNGKDYYSKYSITMINCSNLYRKEKTNFTYII